MRQPVQRGSGAAERIDSRVDEIRDELNERLSVKATGKHGIYTVPEFKLVSPDAEGGSSSYQHRCRVHSFENSIHEEYNGFNPFELQVATALDNLGKPWARNPSRGQGYKIPINELGAKTIWFYPDFLLWNKANSVWAIDPKGDHIAEPAIAHKLLDLSTVEGLKPRIRVAFILEGNFTIEGQWFINKSGTGGYTLVRRVGAATRAQHYSNLKRLTQALK